MPVGPARPGSHGRPMGSDARLAARLGEQRWGAKTSSRFHIPDPPKPGRPQLPGSAPSEAREPPATLDLWSAIHFPESRRRQVASLLPVSHLSSD